MSDFAARLRSLPADTLTALAFFSRVPVRPQPTSFDLRRIAGAWPVAGALLALVPAALLLVGAGMRLPPIVSALIALATMAFLTGAMHEDGLADTADGFGGGATRQRKLEIMRDSRLGTYGALALLFAVLLKAASLGAVGMSPWRAALAIVCAAALSRALALWHWSVTMPARPDGMAASAGRPDADAVVTGAIAGAAAGLLLLIAFQFAALFAILLAAVALRLFSRFTERQIGGHTGDTIGAAQQLTEALLLAGLAAGAAFAAA